MIDELMEKMDDRERKHKRTSKVHRDDTVKTASGAACA